MNRGIEFSAFAHFATCSSFERVPDMLLFWAGWHGRGLDPPLTVLPSVADFTGQQSPLLVAGQPQGRPLRVTHRVTRCDTALVWPRPSASP